jgi:hypothetical protein
VPLDLYDEWIVVAATVFIIGLCVFVHYEGMTWISRVLDRLAMQDRSRMLVLIMGVLCLHTIEIGIFAAGYFLLLLNPIFGELIGLAELTYWDCVYFSTVSYTTLGFGEIVPTDDIRFLTGFESLVGLVLVAWSASFTYIEMQKRWDADK